MKKKLIIGVFIIFFVLISGCVQLDGSLAKEITFETEDGTKVTDFLSKPEDEGRFPALVLVHGGLPSVQAAKELGSGKHAKTFERNGYVVLSIDYI
jgi:dipeptidyl aminopeptidase/acylaminoacyl peptidase